MATGLQPSFCSRSEGAAYLGYSDPESIDRRLTTSPEFVPGKIRFRRMPNGGGRYTVKLWRSDVLALLPPFET